METNNEGQQGMKPTTEWMQANYDRLNKELFGGELGSCVLRPFTSGKGSGGRTLGWFKCLNKSVRIVRSDRRMYVQMPWSDKIYINKSNFVNLFQPCIELNGNYTWSEKAMLSTLLHEMCHYYTYMYGVAPRQAHGTEFKEIGSIVSRRSNGLFPVERLASAEEMSELTLDAEFQEKKDRRLANKKSNMNAVFVFNSNGTIEMSTTTSQKVVAEIVYSCRRRFQGKVSRIAERGIPNLIINCNNAEVIEILFSDGFNTNFKTYRFWNMEKRPIWQNIKQYITPDGDGCTVLFDAKKEQGNLNENNRITLSDLQEIICEAIDRLLRPTYPHPQETEDDSISLSPDMNLSIETPFDNAA